MYVERASKPGRGSAALAAPAMIVRAETCGVVTSPEIERMRAATATAIAAARWSVMTQRKLVDLFIRSAVASEVDRGVRTQQVAAFEGVVF